MREYTVAIDAPNASQMGYAEAALETWLEVKDVLSSSHAVFIVGAKETDWFGVSVDPDPVIHYLESQIRDSSEDDPRFQQASADKLYLTLTVERSGELDPNMQFPLVRFLEQLFLACNLACPGSCGFSTGPIRLDPVLLEVPFHQGRLVSDDSLDATGDHWPALKPVAFRHAWEWLHEDLSYDVEVAQTPAQLAVFSLLILASRIPEDPDNLLALSRAIEGIFGLGIKTNITSTLQRRIEHHFGPSPVFPKWFREFYDFRSRLIHGGTILRPGLSTPHSREAHAFLDAHLGAIEHGSRVLLAALYEMIRSNKRELDIPRTFPDSP